MGQHLHSLRKKRLLTSLAAITLLFSSTLALAEVTTEVSKTYLPVTAKHPPALSGFFENDLTKATNNLGVSSVKPSNETIAKWLVYAGNGQYINKQQRLSSELLTIRKNQQLSPPPAPKNMYQAATQLSDQVYLLDHDLNEGWQAVLALQQFDPKNSLLLLKQTYNTDYFRSSLGLNAPQSPVLQTTSFVDRYLTMPSNYTDKQKHYLNANKLFQGQGMSSKEYALFSRVLLSATQQTHNSVGDVANLSVVQALLTSVKSAYVTDKKSSKSQMNALGHLVRAPLSKRWIKKIASASPGDLLRVNVSLLAINNYLRYQQLKASKLNQLAQAAELSQLIAIKKKIH